MVVPQSPLLAEPCPLSLPMPSSGKHPSPHSIQTFSRKTRSVWSSGLKLHEVHVAQAEVGRPEDARRIP